MNVNVFVSLRVPPKAQKLLLLCHTPKTANELSALTGQSPHNIKRLLAKFPCYTNEQGTNQYSLTILELAEKDYKTMKKGELDRLEKLEVKVDDLLKAVKELTLAIQNNSTPSQKETVVIENEMTGIQFFSTQVLPMGSNELNGQVHFFSTEVMDNKALNSVMLSQPENAEGGEENYQRLDGFWFSPLFPPSFSPHPFFTPPISPHSKGKKFSENSLAGICGGPRQNHESTVIPLEVKAPLSRHGAKRHYGKTFKKPLKARLRALTLPRKPLKRKTKTAKTAKLAHPRFVDMRLVLSKIMGFDLITAADYGRLGKWSNDLLGRGFNPGQIAAWFGREEDFSEILQTCASFAGEVEIVKPRFYFQKFCWESKTALPRIDLITRYAPLARDNKMPNGSPIPTVQAIKKPSHTSKRDETFNSQMAVLQELFSGELKSAKKSDIVVIDGN